jgi:hypothetical protein
MRNIRGSALGSSSNGARKPPNIRGVSELSAGRVNAPIFVPLFMKKLGVAPEAVLAAYRVADSPPNVVTPLMPYFALIVVFAQRYDKQAGVGTVIAMMLPYGLAVSVVWILLFLVWEVLGLPFGPGLQEAPICKAQLAGVDAAGGAAPASAVRRASSLLSSKEVRITVPPSPCKAARTLSVVILRTSRKSAAFPDCRLCAASLMNLSLMPTSASAPPRAPEAAPMAAPARGIRKIMPINAPQNVPETAPDAVGLNS